ncbi:amidohydrolase [Variovorax sp. YR216]|uniref:amidohydrolase family protein n=1 Tax=Variovorax sp. YR216 TaxID=1882828 RepID=UPI000899C4CC|nr:amidohydrolase family protein [Variovorax sp. YR216]SEB08101.1 Predicted metal-dependent hydrolase, TIM-barrel fold [Variovorax sp. YR216]
MDAITSSPELRLVQHRQPDAEWLLASREEAIEPALEIIDAHHHFSEHWGGYMPQDLLEDGAGHNFIATVYIQCGWQYRATGPDALKPVGETEAVVEVTRECAWPSARTRVAAAIVGYADLRLGAAVDEVLEAQRAAGQGRFRGIRNSGAFHAGFRHGVLPRPMPGLYADRAFREGYARLSRHGLSFDAWIYHPQIDEVVDLARAFPDTPLVLDHIGGILGVADYEGRPDLAWREWLPSMKRLAQCPNVSVKIGGLGTAVFGFDFASRPSPPGSLELANAWRPMVETTLELFGTERCIFESNFPVDRSSASYGVVWNALKRLAAGCSAQEKRMLFRDNAARIYGIELVHSI